MEPLVLYMTHTHCMSPGGLQLVTAGWVGHVANVVSLGLFCNVSRRRTDGNIHKRMRG